jgi:hypothetical protein
MFDNCKEHIEVAIRVLDSERDQIYQRQNETQTDVDALAELAEHSLIELEPHTFSCHRL